MGLHFSRLAIAVALVSGGWADPWRWIVQRAQATPGPLREAGPVVAG